MHFIVITLFPEMFQALTDYGVIGRAFNTGLADLTLINPRNFTDDLHHTVDDRPYGGGPGMVMKAEPLALAIDHAKKQLPKARVCYLSPQGQPFCQKIAANMVEQQGQWILLCGRYEGIDQRLLDTYIDIEISIGDYVVSGGEMPAMIMMDAMLRLVPSVLGHQDSAQQDSFVEPAQLDYPHYTRPEIWRDQPVPSVLLSGDHQAIEAWRQQQAVIQTKIKRPDLLR